MKYSKNIMELLDSVNSEEKSKNPIGLQNDIIRRKKVYEGFNRKECEKMILDNLNKLDESTIMKIKTIICNELNLPL